MRKAIALALAAIMPFSNPIIGGDDTLIRNKMQSENYVAGVSGWVITRNGNAEFNNVTARGELIVGNKPGQYVRIGRTTATPGLPPAVELGTGGSQESQPGFIIATGDNLTLQTIWQSPTSVNTGKAANIVLNSFGSPVNNTEIDINADNIIVSNPIKLDQSWTNVPLANSWVDVAGARAGYFKDATGRVQLRGQVSAGTTAVIATLPVGYRPTQSMEWIMRGVGGVIMCAVQVATTGVVSVTANAATAQGSGIKLDSISYPTL